jgi:hypothetical protein
MNRSRIAVKVSNLADGNFHVRAATRNGANIQPSTTVIDYDVDLAAAITENVVRLPARRTISVVLESEPRPNLGGQVMQFVDIGPTENAGTFYSIAAPGTYEFKVFYRFGGKAGGGLSTGETNTATIRFIVR